MRGLVLGYYVTLRTGLFRHPGLRPCRTRCRHCRVFFLTHPRNRGRRDLGCPFGCRVAHRAKRSAARSRAYYGTPAGKQKKQRLNGRRRQTASPGPDPEKKEITMEMAMRRKPEKASRAKPERKPEEEGAAAKADPETEAESAAAKAEEIELDAGMVEHVRMVTSLIEGRKVSREEVRAMLERVLRQPSIVDQKEIDEALRRLREAPP